MAAAVTLAVALSSPTISVLSVSPVEEHPPLTLVFTAALEVQKLLPSKKIESAFEMFYTCFYPSARLLLDLN